MPMARQTKEKQERIIEAVRQGLDGDGAVEFIRQNGYAMTTAGVARHLRNMGGRRRIEEFIEQGLSNLQIMESCFPEADLSDFNAQAPSQGDLFQEELATARGPLHPDTPLYATTKLSIRVPSELYEAIRGAAQGEGKSQNQLIIDILTSVLSRMPEHVQQEMEGV